MFDEINRDNLLSLKELFVQDFKRNISVASDLRDLIHKIMTDSKSSFCQKDELEKLKNHTRLLESLNKLNQSNFDLLLQLSGIESILNNQ